MENALPFVNEREEEMAEVAINVMILFHSCAENKEVENGSSRKSCGVFLHTNVQQVNNVSKTLVKMLFRGLNAALNMLFPGF